jgi:hypothetical protein
MLPIKTPGFQKFRLLKNNHLEGVVEIFNLGVQVVAIFAPMIFVRPPHK